MTDFLVRRFVKDYEKTDNADVRTSYGILSSIVGICCNILLFTAKLLIGAGMNSPEFVKFKILPLVKCISCNLNGISFIGFDFTKGIIIKILD